MTGPTEKGTTAMKIVVDRDKCVGSGACVLAAPRVFGQDEDGIVEISSAEVEPGGEQAVRDAIDACPAAVIEIAY
jgi:ferredoxin